MSDNANNQPTATPAPADNKPANEPAVKPADNKPQAADFDPSKLDDEAFGKVFNDPRLFKHERFKNLNDRAKKADDYEAAQADAENKKLEDEKKFEELSTKQKGEIEGLKKQNSDLQIKFALQAELSKHKVIDQDAALKLVNLSGVSIDKDGNVTGADKAIESLKAEKAYLFGEGSQTLGANGANPAGDNSGVQTFKRSQLRDPIFYAANREEILKAVAAGKIIDDVTVGR